ncbi:MAG: TetR/AcrR family transcriptional regulator [Levilactobacillus sp.]|jgi:AcrR family transcriptional regulator|uniref:TetR/AcrR family transcriptional regulator n=1 Tax=Levilactobacillus sp. TaxID=2767919 RepID=UPI002584A8DB|nr:TetR/AcrR family transcriptional regulator [Levilactobacillus sp.]MCI1553590.1 TetR/AcrR family transcriptional regulator [Levilactobacillus sp.]MCI1599496.1 TetR/AcrR family transcriptional regulator [Levilactobacillus sp.]MCI1606353.1 TetR/AcrR family transcriptional regulator [Levilactobacillus sp.]
MDDKQQRLFTAARDLFLANGFKATSIADIAARANVAVGTFYNFYDAKSSIFLAVYNAENERVKRAILANVDLTADPATVLRTVIRQIFTQSADNLILQEWFQNPKLNRQIAQANQNVVADSVVYATLLTLIDRWQAQGLLAPTMTKARAVSLFNALTVMDFHQSEIQTDDYFQVLNDLITGILKVVLK